MAYAAGASERIVVERIVPRSSASSYVNGLSADPGLAQGLYAVVAPEALFSEK